LSKNSEIFHISGMWKVKKRLNKENSNREGYISGICFLIVFSVAFVLIWNVIGLMEEQYREKLMEFQTLKSLAAYDIRADIYSVMRASTQTRTSFEEDVYMNDDWIYLIENQQIIIQRGE